MGMDDSDSASDDGTVLEQLRGTAQRAEMMNWSPSTGAVVTAAVYTTSGLRLSRTVTSFPTNSLSVRR
jgi:hypothetical protein